MKKLEPCSIPFDASAHSIHSMMKAWREGEPAMRQLFPGTNEQEVLQEMQTLLDDELSGRFFKNDIYQVVARDRGELIHLSIKRLDRKPCRDWRDFQEIKNQLVGRYNEAVELYPAESRKVDGANQYHLWVIKDPRFRFPFGFNSGRIVSDTPVGFSVNRPLDD
jgi:hypothetical protein